MCVNGVSLVDSQIHSEDFRTLKLLTARRL